MSSSSPIPNNHRSSSPEPNPNSQNDTAPTPPVPVNRSNRPSRACTIRAAARLYAAAAPASKPKKKDQQLQQQQQQLDESPQKEQCSKIVTQLVEQPPPAQLPRWTLRSMWELASILNFLHVFRPLLNISIEFSAEEFETALITPNDTLSDIHIPLLKAIPPVTRMALTRDTWVTVLCRKLRDWWHWVADGDLPIVASHGLEVDLYKTLDPGVRVVILKALCDIRVEQEDIRNYIDNSLKHGVQLSAFRKERSGGDSQGISYWYEDDPIIGHRLYREIRKVEVKKAKTKGSQVLHSATYLWETVATNFDEFQDVSEKLFSSKNRTEASLGKKLKIDMLPEIEKDHKRKERLLKKQHRQALLLDNYLSVDGLAPGRSLRDRKPVTYTFDDYDRSINEAIKITKRMQTLISINPINYSNPKFSPAKFLFDFPSLSRESRSLFRFTRRKWLQRHETPIICSASASCTSVSASYGGWEELKLVSDSERSGESDQFRNFLVSVGIDDRKHIFVFLLGLVCALAISRVRVSSIVVFPASVLVFAIGFSFGFVRGGSFSEVSVNGGKRKAKEENFRVYTEKLRNLVNFFDRFNVKVNNLKNDIQKAIDNNEITVGDLENYVNVMESISLSALNARNVVEATIDNVGNSNVVLVENQKPSRRKKELGEIGFELLQSVAGLFGENSVGSKPNKVKDNGKHETVESLVNDQTQANILTSTAEESDFNLVNNYKGNGSLNASQNSSNKTALDEDEGRRIQIGSEYGKMGSGEMGSSPKRFVDGREYSYRNNSLRFTNNRSFSLKMGRDNKTEMWESQDNLFNSEEFRVSMKHMGTEASFVEEQMLNKSSEAYQTSLNKEKSNNETYRFQFREDRLNQEDDSHMTNLLSSQEGEVGSSSSPKVSDDVMFDRYLTEANGLLQQAKEFLRSRHDEEHAEIILYRSANLLSKAIALKPMSLLAVGQLGNTYLLHGELKLKITRALRRTLLSGHGPLPIDRQNGVLKQLDDRITSKDEIASVLVNVCEECEELLVEAGRKYRLALSIDGNDVRALYNWGLALSFRAQLIADIGPEAAFDADKVFLAAIDKFDAMMSKGNVYAPDALFRWGVALQQRSRLRPSNSKDKVKLLQQAKRLYEDALQMDTNNLQVREALSTCISELSFRHY